MDIADAPDFAEDDEQTAWYTPGLYRRIGRRHKRERPKRLSIRQRLTARGLHWNTELVVGVFVAVLVASLVAVAVGRISTGRGADFGPGNGGAANGGTGAGAAGAAAAPGAGSTSFPTPTAPCIAAPIPGSAMRPCTW